MSEDELETYHLSRQPRQYRKKTVRFEFEGGAGALSALKLYER